MQRSRRLEPLLLEASISLSFGAVRARFGFCTHDLDYGSFCSQRLETAKLIKADADSLMRGIRLNRTSSISQGFGTAAQCAKQLNRQILIQGVNLGDSRRVTTTSELGCQKYLHDRERQPRSDQPATQCQHVGIIVLPSV